MELPVRRDDQVLIRFQLQCERADEQIVQLEQMMIYGRRAAHLIGTEFLQLEAQQLELLPHALCRAEANHLQSSAAQKKNIQTLPSLEVLQQAGIRRNMFLKCRDGFWQLGCRPENRLGLVLQQFVFELPCPRAQLRGGSGREAYGVDLLIAPVQILSQFLESP